MSDRERREEQVRLARRMRRERSTPAERVLWKHLRGGRLGVRFRRQEPVGPFIVDFVSHRSRVVVELDGEGHFGNRRDWDRDQHLRSLGYRVLRFENRWVFTSLESLLDDVGRHIADLGLDEHFVRQSFPGDPRPSYMTGPDDKRRSAEKPEEL